VHGRDATTPTLRSRSKQRRATIAVVEIEALLGDPRPRDHDWRDALRAAVDALDDLERPFAALDEHRFAKRPTRHRLIDDPRERWAWLSA
jgi:hypothetical protein